MIGLPDDLPLRRLGRTTVWSLTLELPPEAWIEYQFERRHGNHWERFNDPGNPLQASSPVGNPSVLHTNGYRTPDWTRYDPEPAPGRPELGFPGSSAIV